MTAARAKCASVNLDNLVSSFKTESRIQHEPALSGYFLCTEFLDSANEKDCTEFLCIWSYGTEDPDGRLAAVGADKSHHLLHLTLSAPGLCCQTTDSWKQATIKAAAHEAAWAVMCFASEDQVKQCVDKHQPHVLCLLPDNSPFLYTQLKFAARITLPEQIGAITLQCVTLPKLSAKDNDRGFAANIAQKVSSCRYSVHRHLSVDLSLS